MKQPQTKERRGKSDQQDPRYAVAGPTVGRQPDEVLEIRRNRPHHQCGEDQTKAPERHGSRGMSKGKGHKDH